MEEAEVLEEIEESFDFKEFQNERRVQSLTIETSLDSNFFDSYDGGVQVMPVSPQTPLSATFPSDLLAAKSHGSSSGLKRSSSALSLSYHPSQATLHSTSEYRHSTAKITAAEFDRKQRLRCFFCGGKACKHEDWTRHANPAIKGLNSDWVGTSLLAMQRPSSRLLKEYQIIDQFKRHNIHAVINLQEPGEHPYCGDGLVQGGFTYRPEEFYAANILFYNFGWPDMTTPSCRQMLNIMHVIGFSVDSGHKVAVHCHAGYGRTGVTIACWLIYSSSMTAKEAILEVRKHRHKCVQTKTQQLFVLQFYEYVHRLKIIFPSSPLARFSLRQFLDRQRQLLHGNEARTRRYVPKLVQTVCQRLEMFALTIYSLPVVAAAIFDVSQESPWTSEQDLALTKLKSALNRNDWQPLTQESDARLLSQLLLDWLELLSEPFLPLDKVVGMSSWTKQDIDDLCGSLHLSQQRTLEALVHLLRALDPIAESAKTLLYVRFALALFHLDHARCMLGRRTLVCDLTCESSLVVACGTNFLRAVTEFWRPVLSDSQRPSLSIQPPSDVQEVASPSLPIACSLSPVQSLPPSSKAQSIEREYRSLSTEHQADLLDRLLDSFYSDCSVQHESRARFERHLRRSSDSMLPQS
eukprot:GILK01009820.1.p1 GENE.GILK01009820.1~~GILK01009820.1.p1  ORF type:complete len:635 (-),score=87.68 GILK01009820.1:167-2071(-)